MTKQMTDEDRILWIHDATAYELLSKWRNAPANSPFFRGEVGATYRRVMHRKRQTMGDEAWKRLSKTVG